MTKTERWDKDSPELMLLPCPFCGGAPTVIHVGNDNTERRKVIVKCGECRIERTTATPHGTSFAQLEEWSADGWNRRSLAGEWAISAAKLMRQMRGEMQASVDNITIECDKWRAKYNVLLAWVKPIYQSLAEIERDGVPVCGATARLHNLLLWMQRAPEEVKGDEWRAEHDELLGLVRLLSHSQAMLVINGYVLMRGSEYWHVGIKNEVGFTGFYVGDLAGAIAAMKEAAGVGDEKT